MIMKRLENFNAEFRCGSSFVFVQLQKNCQDEDKFFLTALDAMCLVSVELGECWLDKKYVVVSNDKRVFVYTDDPADIGVLRSLEPEEVQWPFYVFSDMKKLEKAFLKAPMFLSEKLISSELLLSSAE